ncbi:hypothetical protein Hypma_005699 [Hypsizygus marmoreus]|uniref:Ubiquitin-like protease family profile domain-containing protein n=1 Tax=Hypsizygus marmoreus TaxID=39966 RepID=A0A369JZD3_HYPMA|nr:hypothetical protein Hypma_005699 [Hypsizygus marmoreus]
MPKKRSHSVAEQDQPTKRTRAQEREPSRPTSADIYAKYAEELSTWPEVVALRSSTRGTLAADLVHIQTFAKAGHRHAPSLAIYRRFRFMRVTIEELCQDASDCDGGIHSNLREAVKRARTLPMDLMQAQFELTTLQSLAENIDQLRLAICKHEPPLPRHSILLSESLSRLREEQKLNDEIINAIMAYWDRGIQDGYKIACTWQGTMNLVTGDGRPHLKPSPQTLRSMKKKTLYGFQNKPPNTWKRLIVPLHKNANHWVVFVADFKEGVMGVLDSLHNINDPFSENICKASSCFPPEPCTQDFKDLSGAAPFILRKTRCGR